MYCKNCNTYVEETSDFCQECGANMHFENNNVSTNNSIEKNKINYSFIIMLTLLIILIVLFIMLFIKAKNSREAIINNPNKIKDVLNIKESNVQYEIESR